MALASTWQITNLNHHVLCENINFKLFSSVRRISYHSNWCQVDFLFQYSIIFTVSSVCMDQRRRHENKTEKKKKHKRWWHIYVVFPLPDGNWKFTLATIDVVAVACWTLERPMQHRAMRINQRLREYSLVYICRLLPLWLLPHIEFTATCMNSVGGREVRNETDECLLMI